MKSVIVIGDGGHARVIMDLILSLGCYKVVAKLDDKYKDFSESERFYKGPITGIEKVFNLYPNSQVVIAIGSNQFRKKIVENLHLQDKKYLTLIHPSSSVSSSARIGHGTVVMPNTVINSKTEIGNHVIINSGAVVEHDTKIGNYVHVSPLVAVTGAVQIKEGAHIGVGSSIIPMKTVNEWSVVGAGTVVINDVPPNTTVVGSPARPL